VVEAAMARIKAVEGAAAAVLDDISFQVVDLPGDLLGVASTEQIRIDVDAAGLGWFVDATPWDDSEFTPLNPPLARGGMGESQWTAPPASPAADRVDLLTVVLHELGHVLGHDHTAEGVMAEVLPIGVRRVWDELGLPFDLDSDLNHRFWEFTPQNLTPAVIDAAFTFE
jgi:hypothetical protein